MYGIVIHLSTACADPLISMQGSFCLADGMGWGGWRVGGLVLLPTSQCESKFEFLRG